MLDYIKNISVEKRDPGFSRVQAAKFLSCETQFDRKTLLTKVIQASALEVRVAPGHAVGVYPDFLISRNIRLVENCGH